MHWKDGSKYDPPKNPLEEKWAKLYPPCSLSDQGNFDYSCILCSNCPNSDDWEIPEEDKAVWEQYQEDLKTYNDSHGGLGNLILELGIDYWLEPQKGEL